MSGPSTISIDLPGNLPFPITITRVIAQPGSAVRRGTPLFEYAFTSDSARKALAKGETKDIAGEDLRENDMVGTLDCSQEGDVDSWEGWVRPGSQIESKYADRPMIWVKQACTHPVQLHGMCGICGKDLTTDDYLTRPADDQPQAGPSRHRGGFEMSHDALGVTVSTKEARRLENQTRDTLLSSRKLSLIVDLDQTVIHTTVDPTVGEWMAEIDEVSDAEEDATPAIEPSEKARAQDNEETATREERSTTPPGSPKRPRGRRKERNPNAEALKDVAKFEIPDDLPPGFKPPKGKNVVTGPERWYYTKPRPGCKKFLSDMSDLYEMHVYTMGTRSYADAICGVIDPDGKIFGNRIISRDENRNFNSKNLSRLFPTDQSMVVVIDDRADVWGDIPNLVKVVPYDFFVGIGDINSSFLPPTPKSTPSAKATSPASADTDTDTQAEDTVKDELIAKNELLDQVSEARPLAKLQEELDEASNSDANPANIAGDPQSPLANGTKSVDTESNGAATIENRRPLLNNDDTELRRISKILGQIHHTFYRAYDARAGKDIDEPLPLACDVEVIIPDMKSEVLAGCTIVFSGLIPINQRPESADIWTSAETFGARPTLDITPNTTHCVTANVGTEKTRRAAELGINVVWADWFEDSIALWYKQDEQDYLAIQRPGYSSTVPSSRTQTPTPLNPANQSIGTTGGNEDGSNAALSENTAITGSGDSIDGNNGVTDANEDDVALNGRGWDEDADAELEAFLEGSSDYGGTEDDSASRIGTEDSVPPSPMPSVPGSPSKKRVRYADEESLPLESFSDPPDPGQESESPPRKRLLLEAPSNEEDIPPENRFQWHGKMHYNDSKSGQGDKAEDGVEGGEGPEEGSPHAEEEQGSDEDMFAQMLEDSLGN